MKRNTKAGRKTELHMMHRDDRKGIAGDRFDREKRFTVGYHVTAIEG